jgi:CDP-diacylglycerol--serine O-phosphatidyltransferase
MLHFEVGPGWVDRPVVGALTLAVVAFLMVSRLPTFSGKKLHVPRGWMVPTLVMVGLFFAMLASAPWATLLALGIVYLAAIPVSIVLQGRMRLAEAAAPAAAAPAGKPVLSVVGDRAGGEAP